MQDFHLPVRLKALNTEQMNRAVFAFRRYEDASPQNPTPKRCLDLRPQPWRLTRFQGVN